MTDLMFAVAHHLCMFVLFAVLMFELAVLRRGIGAPQAALLARVDRAYGLLAMAMIALGFARAVYAAKGWDYYSHNAFFWAKIATFALVGALSAMPTRAFIQWRRAGGAPAGAEVLRVRGFLGAQLVLFALIPVFAAAMARGYGSLA